MAGKIEGLTEDKSDKSDDISDDISDNYEEERQTRLRDGDVIENWRKKVEAFKIESEDSVAAAPTSSATPSAVSAARSPGASSASRMGRQVQVPAQVPAQVQVSEQVQVLAQAQVPAQVPKQVSVWQERCQPRLRDRELIKVKMRTTVNPYRRTVRAEALRIESDDKSEVSVAAAPTSSATPSAVSASSSPAASSASGMVRQMTPDTAKLKSKCRNFLATLLRRAGEQPTGVAQNVRTLIQDLIDGAVDPEVFTRNLQCELNAATNAATQESLVTFLKLSLPYLQTSLRSGELSIEGVRAPSI